MNYYVDKILKEKKITTFLEEKGIYPERKSSDKLFYRCPIHQGDNDPSFVVFPEGTKGREYQTYHCFACHSGINLINLKSDLDNISTKEAVRSFLKNIEIDSGDAIDSIIESLESDEKIIEDQKKIENILLVINCACKEHLLIYNGKEERVFFDKFFQKVDKIARAGDVETMEGILEILIEKHGLEERVDKFNQKQEEGNLSSMNWRI